MMKIVKIARIAGLLAVAISTSACVSSDQTSQNAIETSRPFVLAEPVSQKLDLPYEQVAQLNISQSGAAQLLAITQPTAILQPTAIAQSAVAAQPTTNLVSRNAAPLDGLLLKPAKPTYRVARVYVDVPAELTVSEANVYVPRADIVWREDPLGDRKMQIKTILEQAIFSGANQISGNTDVIMSVRVNLFHAITQKARDVVGGRHNVQFDYVLLDAVSGQPVSEVNSINLKFKALGGRKALVAEMRGDTQKVRISRHVAAAVYEHLKESTAL